MEQKKVLSIKEVLFNPIHNSKKGVYVKIAKTQTDLSNIICRFSDYNKPRSVQAMISQVIKELRPMPKGMKDAIMTYSETILSKEGLSNFRVMLEGAIEVREENFLTLRKNELLLSNKRFMSFVFDLFKHAELMKDKNSLFGSIESNLSFEYEGVHLDIHLKKLISVDAE